jgi:hypothetical protein
VAEQCFTQVDVELQADRALEIRQRNRFALRLALAHHL